MCTSDPREVIEQTVTVLDFVRRQERGAANLRYVAEGQLGEAAIPRHVRNAGEAPGVIEQLFAGLVRVDLMTFGVDAIIAEAEFVGEVVAKQVRPTCREAAIRIVLDTAEEAAAIPACAVEGAGDNAGLIFVAETEEAVILLGVFLIHANVEVVPGFASNWIRQEIETISINVRQWVQFRDRDGERV